MCFPSTFDVVVCVDVAMSVLDPRNRVDSFSSVWNSISSGRQHATTQLTDGSDASVVVLAASLGDGTLGRVSPVEADRTVGRDPVHALAPATDQGRLVRREVLRPHLRGHRGDRSHHVVEHLLAPLAAAPVAVVARMDRLAELDRDRAPERPRYRRADRLHTLGPGQSDRDDRRTGDHREVRHTAVTTVQQAIARPRAFRIDADELAVVEQFGRRGQRRHRRLLDVALDRHHADRREQELGAPRHPCTPPCPGTRRAAAPSPSGAANRRTTDGWR